VHGKDRAREGDQTLECDRWAHYTGTNIETLNWPKPPMRMELGNSEADW
jgi:hypothetical protein